MEILKFNKTQSECSLNLTMATKQKEKKKEIVSKKDG